MEDLNWLADLVSDCLAFGEKHGLPSVEDRVNAVVDALEMDMGLRFTLPPSEEAQTVELSGNSLIRASNIVLFPWRGRKKTWKLENELIGPFHGQ